MNEALREYDEIPQEAVHEWIKHLQRQGRVYQVARRDGLSSWVGPGGFASRSFNDRGKPDGEFYLWRTYYGYGWRGQTKHALRGPMTEDEAIALVARGAWR